MREQSGIIKLEMELFPLFSEVEDKAQSQANVKSICVTHAFIHPENSELRAMQLQHRRFQLALNNQIGHIQNSLQCRFN